MPTLTPASAPGRPGRLARLLIVDDDPRVRLALAALLESSPGIGEVVACAHTADAEVVAVTAPPDVALVDVLLPGSDDGLRLIRRFTASGIPVVAMSVRGGLRRQAMAAGASAFLEKDGAPEAIGWALIRAMQTAYVNSPPPAGPKR